MRQRADLVGIALAIATIILGAMSFVGCEPPPDVMPMAGGADGGVVAIQQALTFPQVQVMSGLHFREHFAYNPAGDADLTTTFGPMEISPSPYPITAANHNLNGWHGYNDLSNITPVHSVKFQVFTQDPANPHNPWVLVLSSTASCSVTTGPFNGLAVVGISVVDCNADVAWPFLVYNNQIWIYWDPMCPNGGLVAEYGGEAIGSLNDYRISYSAATNWLTAAPSHQGPYAERSYWQLMSMQCLPGSNSMWSHPGPWHDVYFSTHLNGSSYIWADTGPYNWN